MAAMVVVLVFIPAALQPAQDDKEDSCCENEGEDDGGFHSGSLFVPRHYAGRDAVSRVR